MDILIGNRKILSDLAKVPTMNYGQMQRWKDFIPLDYSIELKTKKFLENIDDFFSEFRSAEIEEDDTSEIPELITFKNAGWPKLSKLAKDHQSLLKDLIIYTQYEILHIILNGPVTKYNYYYSVNSIDEVLFEKDMLRLKGICFKSDYIEHTYNHELPKQHALLKTNIDNT